MPSAPIGRLWRFAGRMLGEIAAETARLGSDVHEDATDTDEATTFEVAVGSSLVWLRSLENGDTVDLALGHHVEVVLASERAATAGAQGAMHDGDDLVLSFTDGVELRMRNAAHAGSIVIRGGGQSVIVRADAPQSPSRIFDVTL